MQKEYMNTALSPRERAEKLLPLMTLEEKVGQMMQISSNRVSFEEADEWVVKRFAGSFLHTLEDRIDHIQNLTRPTRLQIPMLFGIDAIHGHALHNGATIFPTQLAMSCSWNPELIEKAGRVTAREVSADGLHWTFSPVLCIGRDLRWGRVNETFGEDPYLIGELAAAIIRGYQGDSLSAPDSILACAKHYLGYGESVGGRDSYDTQASMRKVREVFLPPFKKAVEAGCATFMAGYESIDGTPVSANPRILRQLLKEELGFEGFVVTDWDNVGSLIYIQRISDDISDASKKAIEAGNDMIMVTTDFYNAAIKLVRDGKIPETLIDEAVKRILTIKFAMGLFDGRAQTSRGGDHIFACDTHNQVNLELTRESMVLLKNDNATLPLGSGIKKLAVIGPNADDMQSQVGDWTFYTHPDANPNAVPKAEIVTMLSGIREQAGKRGIEVLYHRGCDIMDKTDFQPDQAYETAMQADAVIAVIGDCIYQNGEGKDRANLDLSGSQQMLLEHLKATGKPLIVVLVNGKPLSIPWVAQNADAILEVFNPGALGGRAAAEILFGEINPSGKLSISFPYHTGQLPVYYNQLPGWHGEQKYMDMPREPLYNFGYGLSYTSFSYSNLRLSKAQCGKEDTVTVSVDVTNTGSRDGHEIVQLYVRDVVSSVVTSFKSLKGFKKVFLKKGETMTVSISLDIASLALVTPEERYVVEPGDFSIMAGSSSRDEDLLKATLTVLP